MSTENYVNPYTYIFHNKDWMCIRLLCGAKKGCLKFELVISLFLLVR